MPRKLRDTYRPTAAQVNFLIADQMDTIPRTAARNEDANLCETSIVPNSKHVRQATLVLYR